MSVFIVVSVSFERERGKHTNEMWFILCCLINFQPNTYVIHLRFLKWEQKKSDNKHDIMLQFDWVLYFFLFFHFNPIWVDIFSDHIFVLGLKRIVCYGMKNKRNRHGDASALESEWEHSVWQWSRTLLFNNCALCCVTIFGHCLTMVMN